jgi:hypothetical protein
MRAAFSRCGLVWSGDEAPVLHEKRRLPVYAPIVAARFESQSSPVACDFSLPESGDFLFPEWESKAMPKLAINKHRDLELPEYNVWFSW